MNSAIAQPAQSATPEPKTVPISLAQRRLWFIGQLQPGSSAYNLAIAWRLQGPLNRAAFERALNEVVRRHASLRTTFCVRNDEPQQEISPFHPILIPTTDLSPTVDAEAEARRMIDAEARAPFDLERGPLFRAELLRLQESEHIFIFNAHHIVWDGWSINLLRHELTLLYGAFSDGKPSPLPELPVQYADVAADEMGLSSGENWKEQLDYWKQQLRGPLPVLELPAVRRPPEAPSFRGAAESCHLDGALIGPLRTLSRKQGATLFMTLLAAFKGLLHRYTGQDDILVGTPVAGRTTAGSEDLIGFFVNTVALRTDLAGDPTFPELLLRVRDTALDAYAHQDVPFDRIVQEVQPERNLGHADPLIQVVMGYESGGVEQWAMGALRASAVDIKTVLSKFDWTFLLEETGGGVQGRLEYNTDLFEAETIKQFLQHFRILLEGIVENPRRHISEFPLLTEAQQRQTVIDWNQTTTDYERDSSVQKLFEAQAARTPEAIAVAFGQQRLTYRELNLRANQLAHYLKQFDIHRDVPVGICVERSVEMVVGWLGILKAGGAYVPLDPTYPQERLAFMLADTRAPVVLTQQRLRSRLAFKEPPPANDRSPQPKVICLDADWKLIAREDRRNPPDSAGPEHLAYVMYTSGSTGQPKGVAVPHRAVIRLVRNTNYIRLDATDRIAQLSNVSFDAATFEIWGALLNGGRLVGISSDVALSPHDFGRELRDQGITALFLTSALFNQVASQTPGAFETVRTVIAGGEALDPKWVRRVLKERPPQRLLNGYGPTENTTFTCCYQVREMPQEATNVPIGRPIANTQVYVLDVHLKPAPIGVPGELYAGGDGLARGYWNRPELTAEKFIPNPFQTTGPVQYLYRTGDLARYLSDGNIEFLGRIDQQVKIRGFRIEPGEIETILGEHPGVRECVVTVCGSETANKRLAAYFVPAAKPAATAGELRSFLASKLPEYMVPSTFVELAGLPLTPNGKVNRKALPAPDQARPELAKRYASPRDEVELQLTKIWEQVLGIRPIGIEDKFFELGGHSLLAVRVIAQMEKAFGRKLRLATIFQAPTIQQLAAIIREEVAESSVTGGTSLVEVQTHGSRPPLFLVHGAAGGMFWGYINLSRHLSPEQPVYGFKSRGLDGREELGSIEEMAAQYTKDLRKVQPHGPYFLGGYCFGGNVAYEMARRLNAQGEQVALLALLECAPPNSRYCRAQWTPMWWLRFFRNVIYWTNYFIHSKPSQRREFVRWKWASLKNRVASGLGAAKEERSNMDGHLFNMDSFSEEQRKLWETHMRALLEYNPKPYAGRVHLFRSPGHPLWCSFDPDYGWEDLAAGGVTTTVLPGVHEKILEEPCVKAVASEMEKFLLCVPKELPQADRPAPAQAASPVLTIARATYSDAAPLSLTQQRVWFLDQLERGQAVYCHLGAIRFRGELDIAAVERSLNEIVRRHEVLRTIFPTENGKPVQRIQAASPWRLDRIELTEELRAEAIRKSFGVTAEAPIRAGIFKSRKNDHILVLAMHELAADSATFNLIFEELHQLYEASSAGKSSPLAELALQYADFAIWQRGQEQEHKWDDSLIFWKKQLAGAAPLLDLPTDLSRPAVQSYRAKTERRSLSRKLAQDVKSFAQAHGTSEDMVFLAGLNLLLQRYSRQDDILIGIASTHREGTELKKLAGNFANLLVMRADLGGNPTGRELLSRVKQVNAAALSHREAPFGKLVEELQPTRAQSYHPLCQVLFTHKAGTKPATGAGVELMELDQAASKFDLIFQVTEAAEGAELRVEYATDLFAGQSASRMLGHWETLVAALVVEPDRKTGDLPMLTADEKQVTLIEWNNTEREYPKQKTLIGLFEEQVARTPEAQALVCGNSRLTYRDLDEQASQIADRLRSLGVGNEALVGICLERSWEMVAGILGTLRAGGAYVPMDPAYPKDRIAFMLEDAKVRVLLTQQKLIGSIPKTDAHILCVEDLKLQPGSQPAQRRPFDNSASKDLAYVIYTSGSTGRPKGVAIEHQQAVALVCWAKDIFSSDELSGMLASTSICFDLSVFEMFLPLSWGGTVILAENLLALPALPARDEVKLINTVPSAIRELVRVKGVPNSVRVINLAGEPLATSLVEEIYLNTSAEKVYDLYGPTETTTYSTFTLRKSGGPATIGRPLANEQVYLLDRQGQPVPIGVPGELYIGGDGVARGYLGRPDLTAEKFVANPFRAGERLYRTGDLARWRPDGNIEYVGRMDYQVKIRGFRIELGEIEAVLKKQPGVREAVVVAREDQPGQKRIAAYVVANEKKPATADELRAAIREKLPDYMTPSFFVFLEALPLTPNGKVDRKALPAPEQNRQGSGAEFVAPSTPNEERLAAIWTELLGLKQAGIHDNFFDLGGHSLLAIQAISRIREIFKVEIPLIGLFDAPTIASLAEGLSANRWAASRPADLALQPLPRTGPLPVSFVQERLWFLDQLEVGSHAYNVPLALRLKGKLNPQALQRALDEIIRRHEALRTTFTLADDKLTQVIAPNLAVEIQQTDLQSTPSEARKIKTQKILNEEAQRPFDLARGPLLRAHLVRLKENDHAFSVVLHHTVSDGWSLAIFFEELELLYNAFAAGEPCPQLAKLPVQYADFAQWQRKWMQGTVLQEELAYWKAKLTGAPSAVDLPADCGERDRPTGVAEQRTLQIPSKLANALIQMSQRDGSTPFIVLMTALAITLHKWSTQKDLVLGTVVAGRNQREIEKLIGCFMNFLPIRTEISGTETAREILAAVKTSVLEAQTHQECPFEKIVEAINPHRTLNQNPLYNVALLLQSFPSQPFQAEGLESIPMPVSMHAALLDLRFEANQRPDGIELVCEYRTDLFEEKTIEQLLASYQQILETLVRGLGRSLSDFKVTADLQTQAVAARERKEKQTVAIAATFTAEPLEESLRYWLKELEMSGAVEFAPYNQIFQQLLDPGSLLSANQRGLNVVLVRLEDWQRSGPDEVVGNAASFQDHIERNAAEFVVAIRTAAARNSAPCLICLCPTSKPTAADPVRANLLAGVERRLKDELGSVGGVYVTDSAELAELYPVSDYYDPSGDELGHVPYTPLFFTALGTLIARKLHALVRPPHKVIVLDCDQTLWSGVCGEDGPRGIRLDAPFQSLQKFMRAQHEAGMLLCLCSKNNEDDVNEVFAQRLDMPLRREHLIGSRLNWQPKSENLKSLAQELGLGLDSFIFVDDNPVECAEVEANCPDVLTIQLPEDPQQIPQFLRHCWVFDHLTRTTEDIKRGEMYRQNRQREQLRAKTMSLADFITGLDLHIQISPMTPEQLTRVAQLTQRTNQFNFTTRRRTESDLQKLLGGKEVLTVSVKDRFGDYGLVGVIIWEGKPQSLDVDTLLLSCRVLGRGVEHRMLEHLGEIATERALPWVDLHFTKTEKNSPANDFLEQLGSTYKQSQNGGFLFRFPASVAARIEFHPQPAAPAPALATGGNRAGLRSAASSASPGRKFNACRAIAIEAGNAAKIHGRIEAGANSRSVKRSGYSAPHTDLERQLCELWQKLLHIERVGVRDDFFELGGHSLLAVRLFVEVEKLTGRKLPLVTLFQSPTIERLAGILSQENPSAFHSLLVPIQPRGSKPPLFLVHGAGGDVLWGYANLAAHLRPEHPIYGIKSRGQAGLDEFTNLEDMAAYYLAEVRAFQPRGPYYLGGYCFGGNVAYEMARQMRAQGEQVALLALIDSAPSNAGYERATWLSPRFMYSFARNVGYWLSDFRILKPEERRNFFARKLRTMWRKALRRLKGRASPPTVDLEEVIDPSHFSENELKLWRMHLQALTDHVEQPYPGQVTLLRTRGQPLICSFEPDFCWGRLAREGVQVKPIPGSHENIFMEPNVKQLAKELETCLAQAGAQTQTQTAATLP